jgi:2-hydroxychromene-2-carboxylate isomerase
MIAFHFDYISPYAYLAWTQIHALAERHGERVVPVPTLLAALLAHGATKGPAEIPAKRTYLFFDVARSAHLLRVPLAPPRSHPFNPLIALRATSLDMTDEERTRLTSELFSAVWARRERIETAEQVAQIAARVGLDGADIARRAAELDAKDRLRKQTDDAIAKGVFGVPTLFAKGEMFWGLDSFGHLERHLKGDGPDVRGMLAAWLDVKPTAQRKL